MAFCRIWKPQSGSGLAERPWEGFGVFGASSKQFCTNLGHLRMAFSRARRPVTFFEPDCVYWEKVGSLGTIWDDPGTAWESLRMARAALERPGKTWGRFWDNPGPRIYRNSSKMGYVCLNSGPTFEDGLSGFLDIYTGP